jgi:hypothetical protein
MNGTGGITELARQAQVQAQYIQCHGTSDWTYVGLWHCDRAARGHPGDSLRGSHSHSVANCRQPFTLSVHACPSMGTHIVGTHSLYTLAHITDTHSDWRPRPAAAAEPNTIRLQPLTFTS